MSTTATSYEGSLLLTLEEVSRLVSHSHDPGETLNNIVRLIQGRCHTAVCSVYFLEPVGDELVLAATVGLKSESVGRIRMRVGEGLTGLVAEQKTPVMVADAFKHPRFKYFPEAGEDPYHSFLGVPLVEGGALQGVLVVQTAEPRTFSASEVRMLVTVAAQVASLVADARLLAQVSAAAHAGPAAVVPLARLTGVSLSPGTGIGQAYVVDGFEEWRQTVPARSNDPNRERRRLHEAMGRARAEIDRLSHRISELVGEDHGAILQAQLMIMQDRTVENDLEERLRAGASAEAALLTTLDKYVAAFQKVSTPFFQERVYDIKDVFHRLLWQLRERPGPEAGGDRLVLVAREASVLELFAVDLDRLAGVVVEHGGPQSHAAILARSLGIPMVGQVEDFADLQHSGRRLLVDGSAGTVLLDPPMDLTVPGPAAAEVGEAASPAAGLPRVEVNINLLWEAEPAVRHGATGVGLYRSEFLFLARRTLPTEEEQVGIYRKLLQRLAGRPVTLRTFDLRPDKLAAYSRLSSVAARPFDWRRALESPPLQQLFHEQVRAILRAAVVGPARILVPLVTRTELLDFVLTSTARARAELAEEEIEFAADVPLGIMIEAAAAVPLVNDWIRRVDFLALGTNDLAASALGLDRDDPEAAGMADTLHPGILRLLDGMTSAAHAEGKPVSVCGEMAADPLGALALATLGVDSLSVPVNRLISTRRSLAGISVESLQQHRAELLKQQTSEGVRRVLGEIAGR